MPQLPDNLPSGYHHVEDLVIAYYACRRAEEELRMETVNSNKDLEKKLVCVRILGFLLHYSPSEQGLKTVAKETSLCACDVERLCEAGKFYLNHYIRAYMINATLEDTPQSYTSQAKGNALIRDNSCYCLPGAYDVASVQKNVEHGELIAEICPCSTFNARTYPPPDLQADPIPYQRDYTSSIWATMSRFGYEGLAQKLDAAYILSDLVGQNEPLNKYNLESQQPYLLTGCKELVDFTSTNPKLSVPSSTYLRIHAGACPKVAPFSGAAEYIDRILQDLEDMKVLSLDGSSSRR
ncbi:hypothetical protein NP233_g6525 [Leucocoprinus birnbaumii]|uniref:Uncharacterized protein n=1 Tax=Leucocoprinus birnbaumii TaxID=56174 RepID=A0AAD5VR05_9AGAR|nr:hypothetical protein NP233_g6525 [Leucocoprinus birnbaumii]